MTIFLKIIQKILIEEITTLRDKSVIADVSLSNYLMNGVGFGRDLILSKTKRNFSDKLLHKVRNLIDEESDLHLLTTIKGLLKKYKEKAQGESLSKGYLNEGTFGPAMEKLSRLIDNVWLKLEEMQLLNIEYDTDPLNIFRYHMAYYCVKKIINRENSTLLQRISTDPKVSNSTLLTKEKEELILKCLLECPKDIIKLDTTHKEHDLHKKNRVCEWIHNLKQNNHLLCVKYTKQKNFPIISINFFSTVTVSTPTGGPSPGLLAICLENAIKDIESTPPFIIQPGLTAFNATNMFS